MSDVSTTEPFGPSGSGNKKPKKGGIGKYILIAAILLSVLGIGTCTWQFVGLFDSLFERQAATNEFARKTLAEGMPGPSDPIWHPDITVSDEAATKVTRMMNAAGPAEDVGLASCNVNSQSGTNITGGTFASCNVAVTYENTRGSMFIQWKAIDEDWKLYAFRVNYDDVTALMDREAEMRDEQSED